MVLGVSLKKVWMLMNTLQILTNVPLLSIALPSNVLFTLQSLADLAKFNIIPKAQIKKYLSELNLSSTSGEKANENQQKGNFKTMGFENSNIFENLGLLFFVLVGFVAIGIIVLALRFIVKKFKWQDHSIKWVQGTKAVQRNQQENFLQLLSKIYPERLSKFQYCNTFGIIKCNIQQIYPDIVIL
ncbi:hypothetical protein FGO68_gene12997 [Halteria grandinella]|uniref:Uncharacterized protein n=1 Tax=Halteria grandinella TaxID=5974 RepID=A0A8J8NGF0_HALGN|nr:hypothetical protein FGO68_gene12997 [Halteria grandinella]